MSGLDEAIRIAAEDTDATHAVQKIVDGYREEIALLRKQLARNDDKDKIDKLIDELINSMKANRDIVVALALKGTAADADSGVEPTPITVPAMVPGQPSTTLPGGRELPPFSNENFPHPESVDKSTPKPHGHDAVKPEEQNQ